jgi:NMD protein affecting ribosome stability and mRNA decay
MKRGRIATGGRGRSLDRRGTRAEKTPSAGAKPSSTAGPTVCYRCGSVFARKTWRRDHKVNLAFFDNADWTTCPACTQSRRAEGFGKVVLRGSFVAANEDRIRRRIANVADRAAYTQPQRRVSSIARTAQGLEVVTTSQKLAHRIARELKKAFRGNTTYAWSDRDGALRATWERDDEPPAAAKRPRRR